MCLSPAPSGAYRIAKIFVGANFHMIDHISLRIAKMS